jgi:hypothetical protein
LIEYKTLCTANDNIAMTSNQKNVMYGIRNVEAITGYPKYLNLLSFTI